MQQYEGNVFWALGPVSIINAPSAAGTRFHACAPLMRLSFCAAASRSADDSNSAPRSSKREHDRILVSLINGSSFSGVRM